MPSWLGRIRVPLFVSRRRLCRLKRYPQALGPWALDSGGFSELTLFGRWTVTPRQYVTEVRLWRREIGNLAWAAVMDHMCEPFILEKTRLTIRDHQRSTVENYLRLRTLAPDLPWVPVLQGWCFDDYLRHLEDYRQAGVDLRELPLVGLGSVCRRQATAMVEELIRVLAGEGLRLHGFGFKLQGLARAGRLLQSADSLAWSFAARKRPPLPGCPHPNCQNCQRFALRWRRRVLRVLGRGPGLSPPRPGASAHGTMAAHG